MLFSKIPMRAGTAFALVIAACAWSFAQTAPTTSLTGLVLDASGAAVSNATLAITNTATHYTKRGAER